MLQAAIGKKKNCLPSTPEICVKENEKATALGQIPFCLVTATRKLSLETAKPVSQRILRARLRLTATKDGVLRCPIFKSTMVDPIRNRCFWSQQLIKIGIITTKQRWSVMVAADIGWKVTPVGWSLFAWAMGCKPQL